MDWEVYRNAGLPALESTVLVVFVTDAMDECSSAGVGASVKERGEAESETGGRVRRASSIPVGKKGEGKGGREPACAPPQAAREEKRMRRTKNLRKRKRRRASLGREEHRGHHEGTATTAGPGSSRAGCSGCQR